MLSHSWKRLTAVVLGEVAHLLTSKVEASIKDIKATMLTTILEAAALSRMIKVASEEAMVVEVEEALEVASTQGSHLVQAAAG